MLSIEQISMCYEACMEHTYYGVGHGANDVCSNASHEACFGSMFWSE